MPVKAWLPASVALLAVLASSSGAEVDPAVAARNAPISPRILYSSDWTGHSQIFAVDPVRPSATRQVTFGGDGFVEPNPSPDGRLVAYLGSPDPLWDRPGGLWIARANGTLARQVGAGYVTSVSWSPDSRRLAYMLGRNYTS